MQSHSFPEKTRQGVRFSGGNRSCDPTRLCLRSFNEKDHKYSSCGAALPCIVVIAWYITLDSWFASLENTAILENIIGALLKFVEKSDLRMDEVLTCKLLLHDNGIKPISRDGNASRDNESSGCSHQLEKMKGER